MNNASSHLKWRKQAIEGYRDFYAKRTNTKNTPTMKNKSNLPVVSSSEPILELMSVPIPEPIVEVAPKVEPVVEPVVELLLAPVVEPTVAPVVEPVVAPVVAPVVEPLLAPVVEPLLAPVVEPTVAPAVAPVVEPTVAPAVAPVVEPAVAPAVAPVVEPVVAPTVAPVVAPMITVDLGVTVKPAIALAPIPPRPAPFAPSFGPARASAPVTSINDGLIPIMTSATTDGYTISASTEYNITYSAWKACDGKENTSWAMKGNKFPSWWQVQCPMPMAISYIEISKRNNTQQWINDFTFEGSNDGLSWTILTTSNGKIGSIGVVPNVLRVDNTITTPYTYYRINCASGVGRDPGFSIFQMYAVVPEKPPTIEVIQDTSSSDINLSPATEILISEAVIHLAKSGNTNPTHNDVVGAITAAMSTIGAQKI